MLIIITDPSKKSVENSTLEGEGSGPGHFPQFFFNKKLC